MAEEKKNNNKPNEAKQNRQNNKEVRKQENVQKETPKKNNEVDIEALKKELKEELRKELEEEQKELTKNAIKESVHDETENLKEDFNTKKEEVKETLNEKKEEFKESLNGASEEVKTKAEDTVKSFENKAKETVEKIMDTKDDTSEHDTTDIEANKGMAIISYLGPLCLVPFLVSKESKFSQYHAKQGLNLFVIEIVFAIVSGFLKSIIQIPKMCSFLNEVQIECGVVTPWWLTVSLSLVELLLAIIALIGIVYACQGKAKELPLISRFKVIK